MKKKGVSRNFLVSIILSVLSSALLYCIAILNLGLDILKNDLSNTQKTVITGILIVLLIWSFTYTVVRYFDNLYIFLAYMISLSIVTGLTFTYLTYIIKDVIGGELPLLNITAYTFFITVMLYAYSIKVVRHDVTVITNELIYKKKDKIINTISNCDYETFQSIGSEKIYTCINNDTEFISSEIDAAVSCVTSIIVLICCCIYLFIFNFKLTCIALFTIALVFGIVLVVSSIASKEWNKSRDKQNVFYKYLTGLIDGFETLVNKKKKMREFTEDVNKSNRSYTKSRIKAEVYFAYSSFITEGLIFVFLGFIMLILPLMSSEFSLNTLGEFFIVFVMLKGHYDMIVNLSD
ncbi:ABC transporter transmembrane region [Clostridium sp. DSM 8431]|uniref:ABC transporter transmembrane domain-containing protein n=1 Tax=Clostridium sp. DSM 8431 TaxID=1761781 RepID=UPI0008DF75AC|nr:ABC transporter transmembrane domain-containing protein [Clostridium sp. DSM 8431]SFU74447.1 ABC transporter transmembrane region [Clostridium sp. DSM 8431]